MAEQTSFNLSYDCRDSDTRDIIITINICFDNPSEDSLRNKLNTWLKAIGSNLQVE